MKKSLFLAIFLCFSLWAMEESSTSSVEVLSSKSEAFIENLTQAIDQASSDAHVYIESPFFSNDKVIKALKSCAQRGCTIHFLLGRKSQNLADKLREIGVHISINHVIHAKRFIIDDAYNSIAFLGSDNCSQTSQFSHEVMVKFMNPDLIKRQIEYFNADKETHIERKSFFTPEKKRVKIEPPISSITPDKPTVRGTPQKLIPFKLERFGKLEEADTGEIYITSMTCNHPELVERIEALNLPKHKDKIVTLVLDRAALNNKDLLNRMHKAGAQIYIFNKDKEKLIFNKFPALQHSKLFLRKIGDNYLSIVSTGNWTTQSMNQHNSDVLEIDKKIFNQLFEKFEEIRKDSKLYDPNEE